MSFLQGRLRTHQCRRLAYDEAAAVDSFITTTTTFIIKGFSLSSLGGAAGYGWRVFDLLFVCHRCSSFKTFNTHAHTHTRTHACWKRSSPVVLR